MKSKFSKAVIAAFLVVGLYESVSAQEVATRERVFLDSVEVAADDSAKRQVYELKKELLLVELQLRGAGHGNVESTIHQSRLALVTILVALLAYFQDRAGSNRFFLKPRTTWLISFSVVLCMYASDSFMLDLTERTALRIKEIFENLSALPRLSSAAVAKLETYPDLTRQCDILRKAGRLFSPNYAQALAYAPVGILLVVMFCRLDRVNRWITQIKRELR